MELREYLKIIKKNSNILLYFVIMAAAAGLVITFWLPQKHKGSFSLFIVKKQTQKTEDYKYDQFYAARTQEKLGEFAKQ